MSNPSWQERWRYQFDNFMSRGPLALIAGLGLVSLLIVAAGSLALQLFNITVTGGVNPDFLEGVWISMTHTLDAGTVGGAEGFGFRLVMFLVTMGGIFVVSALIGVLNNGLEDKLGELRKGRSRVIESNHTIILGWSEQIFSVLSELVAANASQPNACLVVMADKDKVEMEEAIKDRVTLTGKTRIVCRSGQPMNLDDLEIVSLVTAKAIIILGPAEEGGDAQVIKTLLAITNNPKRRPQPYHVVAEVHDPRNVEVAKMVGKDEVEVVLVGDLVSRIIAQTCRQSGLSIVYTELLDFGGDEIYFKTEPTLVGKTFGETLTAYEDSTVIGIYTKAGVAQLNPAMATQVSAGDQLVVIAEDDDKIHLSGKKVEVNRAAIQTGPTTKATPERTLVLGWNWRAPTIIRELDRYVAPGSVITVVAEAPRVAEDLEELRADLQQQTLTYLAGDTTERRLLDSLQAETYQHIIVLSYSDEMEAEKADSRTLMTLLHLRDMGEKSGKPLAIVSEMLDVRNRELAEVTRADDFIVSDKLISLLLAQISENKALNAVFTDIFDPEGSEIYVKPASNYVALNTAVNFYTVLEAARQRGEVAIGYRLKAQASDPRKAYGVVVNPTKSEQVKFTEADKVIVLADQ